MRASHRDIERLARYLVDGEQASGLRCPVCDGGTSGENTLSVKRDGMLIRYICHRASCGIKGIVGASYEEEIASPSRKKRTLTLDAIKLGDVPRSLQKLVEEKYLISERLLNKYRVKYDLVRERLALPVVNRYGIESGYSLRSFKQGEPKKSLLVLQENSGPAICWYYGESSDSLVIVEDQLSALRCTKYCDAVALLGTGLSEEKVKEIKQHPAKNKVICLDNDASSLAIKFVRKYQGVVDGLRAVLLNRDIKDMSMGESDILFYSSILKESNE